MATPPHRAGLRHAPRPAVATALVGGIDERIPEAIEDDRADRRTGLAGPVAAPVRRLLRSPGA